MDYKIKACADEECTNEFKQFNSTVKYCSAACFYKNVKPSKRTKKTPVKKVSAKRQKEQKQYSKMRRDFLAKPENHLCKIKSCKCTHIANTIEHTKGRQGYADDWAREQGITLYLDVRYWLPACLACNLELENNPELSKANQLSKLHHGKKI